MNFTTDLPKRNPLVSYIVASGFRYEKFLQISNKSIPAYRMHVVILKIKQGVQTDLVPINLFNGKLNGENGSDKK